MVIHGIEGHSDLDLPWLVSGLDPVREEDRHLYFRSTPTKQLTSRENRMCERRHVCFKMVTPLLLSLTFSRKECECVLGLFDLKIDTRRINLLTTSKETR